MSTQPTEWYDRVCKLFDEKRSAGQSSEQIFLELLGDLKRLARMRLARQPAGASMNASRLISDLYFRLFANRADDALQWESAGHCVAYITKAMKNLLIDHARHFVVRGGHLTDSLEQQLEKGLDFPLTEGGTCGALLSQERVEHAIYIDQLLEQLAQSTPECEKAPQAERQANIVRLRLFLGYTEEETAAMLGCSSETVTKESRKARARMAHYIEDSADR